MKKPNSLALIIAFIGVFTFIGCSGSSATLKISDSSLDFGEVNLSENKTLMFSLTNKYSDQITIDGLTLTDTTNYVITNGGTTPITMEHNDEHVISIRYEPTTGGIHDAELLISYSESTKDKIVKITGTGKPIAKISVSTNSIDFYKVLINKDKEETISIENTGTFELTINSLQFVGAGAGAYNISSGGAVPFVIQPLAITDIKVKFSPIAVQTYAADLQIEHDGKNESTPVTVTITGDGVVSAQKITLDKTSSWDFGTVGVGLVSVQSLEISNTGTDPLTVNSAILTNSSEFVVDSVEDAGGSPISLPQAVAVGAKIYVKIRFTPVGNVIYSDTLEVEHNGINESSPISLSIEGEGRIIQKKTFGYVGSIETWTVPAGVSSITIEVWGAQGGINDASQVGGWGAQMKGTFAVSPGDTLKILVGEQGAHGSTASWSRCGGGSGGSFVWKDGDSLPMIVAGGGGGKGYLHCSNSMDASTTTTGVTGFHPGGTNGNGGTGGTVLSDDGAGGGGGWLSDGTGLYPGYKIYNGTGAGSTGAYNDGGFGGGGGSSNSAGGGGGYSGGGGGFYGFNTNPQYNGGGGGSYNAGTNQSNNVGSKAGNGQIEIQY